MLKINSQIKLGKVYNCNYDNDEYSFDDIINLITDSRTVVNRVTVSNPDNPQLNMIVSFQTFLEGKDFITESTLEPGETSVRLLGTCEQANITITMDPLDMSNIIYTSDNVNYGLGDCLKKKEQTETLKMS